MSNLALKRLARLGTPLAAVGFRMTINPLIYRNSPIVGNRSIIDAPYTNMLRSFGAMLSGNMSTYPSSIWMRKQLTSVAVLALLPSYMLMKALTK